jgi:hypothetical protein
MRAERTLRIRINLNELDPSCQEAEAGDREDDLTLNFESPAVFFACLARTAELSSTPSVTANSYP